MTAPVTTPLAKRITRFNRMVQLRDVEGWTLDELATEFKLSKTRVSQILDAGPPTSDKGGRPRTRVSP